MPELVERWDVPEHGARIHRIVRPPTCAVVSTMPSGRSDSAVLSKDPPISFHKHPPLPIDNGHGISRGPERLNSGAAAAFAALDPWRRRRLMAALVPRRRPRLLTPPRSPTRRTTRSALPE